MEEQKSAFTLRAYIVGMILVVVFTVYVTIATGMMPASLPESLQLISMVPVLFVMFALLLISSVLRDRGFSAGELILIYVMVSSVAAMVWLTLTVHIPYYDMMVSPSRIQISTYSYGLRNLQPSFWLPNPDVMRPMTLGGSQVPWNAWIIPLAFWLLFLMSLMSYNIFFTLIYSYRLVVVERLPFPMAQALTKIIDEPKKPLRERTGWNLTLLGIVIGFLVQGTYWLFPMIIPGFKNPWPVVMKGLYGVDLGPTLGPELWANQLLEIPLTALPFYIPLFFIMPTNVVGTALLTHFTLQNIIPVIEYRLGMVPNIATATGGAYGVVGSVLNMAGTELSSTGIQLTNLAVFGFPVGVMIGYIILSHKALTESFKSAIQGEKTGPFSSRILWIGFIGSLAVFVALCVISQMPIQTALLLSAITLLIFHTRVRLESEAFGEFTATGSGAYGCTMLSIDPSKTYKGQGLFSYDKIFYSSALLTQSATASTAQSWFGQSFMTISSLPDSFKLCELTKIDRKNWRSLALVAMISMIVSAIIALIIYVWGAYNWGFSSRWTGMTWGTAADEPMRNTGVFATSGENWIGGYVEVRIWPEIIVGAVFAGAITVLKFMFPGFPIHPLGLVMGSSYINFGWFAWFSAVIGLIAKYAVLKIGGTELYEKRGLPLAIGSMVGYGIAQFAWGVVYIILSR